MKLKGLRWWVLGLVVLITIINYLDRGTLNYMWVANTKLHYPVVITEEARPSLPYAVYDPVARQYALHNAHTPMVVVAEKDVTPQKDNTIEYIQRGGIAYELGLVDQHDPQAMIDDQLKKLYSYIYMFFMVAYGVSQLVSGKLYDRIGTRKGFVVSALIWGTADMLTCFATGIVSLGFFRVLLGLGEAGPWPGTVKSNAEWFPVKERAFAQGLFGAGGSIGNILAPVIISFLFIAFGWRNTFVIVGSLGIIWIIPWLILNRKMPKEHPWITEEEKQHIVSGQPLATATSEVAKSWSELLRDRKSYAVVLGRFFLDPIWWMFVAWLPIYLSNKFKLDIKQVAFSAWVPYVGGAVGAIAGGWFSGLLIRKGKAIAVARKIAITTGACITLPAMIAAAYADTALVAVLIMAFILGGFQFTIVNIQTLPSDYHSGKTVGSLAGLGGASAVLGTIITMFLVPYITTGNNWVLFFVMGALLVPLSVGAVFVFSDKRAG
ncbi:major facilitator superfamily domain-containing protein [Russula earlei]|uniref:Major facilitator superfamily domain-containing protein n=1 Tax=Russula earlei TaxID=71964 RepID=A0ACC0TTH9_9AGAM|nr:major facilitator superfamily domain-containing protein [Russula earlei]